MRLVTIIFALVLSVWMVAANMDMTFGDFVVKYHKKYSNAQEKHKREQIYAKNVAKIDQLNKESQEKGWTTKFGVNSLADLEDSEITSSRMGLKKAASHKKDESRVAKQTITTTTTIQNSGSLFDWTTANPPVVTPVKNQGGCGSCWAFASAATLEGYYANKLKMPLTSLSEQQMVDCDTTYAYGCNGGDPYYALQYEMQNGAETESTYPYISGPNGNSETCQYNSALEVVKPMGVSQLSSESELMNALEQYGPLVVTLHADDFFNYMSGVFMAASCNSTSIDHAVTLVGYGTLNGVDYWKIKNSWGTSWGENGYFLIERNQGACGIGLYSVYISQ